MAEKENGKLKKWQIISGIVIAALTAYSTIFVSLINASGAKESSVKTLITELNDKVIPQLQEVVNKQDDEIDRLKDKNADLRERLAKIEGMFMVGKEEMKPWLRALGAPSIDIPKKTKEKKKRKLHKVDLQQVLK